MRDGKNKFYMHFDWHLHATECMFRTHSHTGLVGVLPITPRTYHQAWQNRKASGEKVEKSAQQESTS